MYIAWAWPDEYVKYFTFENIAKKKSCFEIEKYNIFYKKGEEAVLIRNSICISHIDCSFSWGKSLLFQWCVLNFEWLSKKKSFLYARCSAFMWQISTFWMVPRWVPSNTNNTPCITVVWNNLPILDEWSVNIIPYTEYIRVY